MKTILLTFYALLIASTSLFSQEKQSLPLPSSHPDDVFWDDGWGPSALGGGSDAMVFASCSDGTDVYFGGDFLYAGEKTVNHIVRWDGSHWNTLGAGTNGDVRAITVHNGAVYIGGNFTTAGGVTVNHVAKWDGNQWTALGTGFTGSSLVPTVYALTFVGDVLYAGGDFDQAGSLPVNNIARWDGTQWTEVNGGVNGTVRALAVNGNALYAGGDFHWAGPVTGGSYVYHVARFDGATWHALGTGTDDKVCCLAVHGNALYAGGSFMTSGSVATNYLSKWDGTAWSAVENSIFRGSGENPVNALAFDGDNLYVGGNFNISGWGMYDCVNFAMWDGSSWYGCGYGFQGYQIYTAVHTICQNQGLVYAGGYFTVNGSTLMRNLGTWNGSEWIPTGTGFGKGMDRYINALAVWNGDLWAGGMFERAGDTQARYIARWNGWEWSEPGGGTSYEVKAFLPMGSDLFVGGGFTYVGNQVMAGGIARWDGSTWHSLGQGFSSTVYAMANIGTDIYIGRSGAVVNKWDGNAWSLIGTLGGTVEGVKAMAVIGTDLYIGGTFTDANGVPANYVAKWNGFQWSALGSGMNQRVMALAAVGNDLYAGGWFTQAGGNEAKYIARWDGTQWWPVAGGVNDIVSGLANIGGELYVGGRFSMAGTIQANCIAKWDGTEWTTFGSGMENDVFAFAKPGGELYTGGFFESAGEKSSAFIASWLRWPVKNDENRKGPLGFVVSPNPTGDQTTLAWTQPSTGNVDVMISDIAGRILRRVFLGEMAAGEHHRQMDLSAFPPGTFLCTIQSGNRIETVKLIVIR